MTMRLFQFMSSDCVFCLKLTAMYFFILLLVAVSFSLFPKSQLLVLIHVIILSQAKIC